MGFLTSKFSGYLSIILLVSVIGGGWYMYQRGVTFGELMVASEEQAATIEEQKQALARVSAENKAKDAALQTQEARTKQLRNNARLQQLAVQEAMKNADKAVKQCLNMHIADGMCFGPGCKDGSDKDKARSDLDG